VPTCIGRRFYRFPADDILAKLWFQVTGRAKGNIAEGGYKNLEVCSMHFTIDQFIPSVLVKYKNSVVPPRVKTLQVGAIPSINLRVKTLSDQDTGRSAAKRARRNAERNTLKSVRSKSVTSKNALDL
jgi:THAP domain